MCVSYLLSACCNDDVIWASDFPREHKASAVATLKGKNKLGCALPHFLLKSLPFSCIFEDILSAAASAEEIKQNSDVWSDGDWGILNYPDLDNSGHTARMLQGKCDFFLEYHCVENS